MPPPSRWPAPPHFRHQENARWQLLFRIVHEGTAQRYLTGSDFDTESFQFAGGALWIGDEFGPFLIKADLKGRVLAVFSKDGSKLYPLLEGALWDEAAKEFENINGRQYLRVLEFDVSWWAMTTTCPTPAAASPTRRTTTNWCCWKWATS